MGDLQKKSPSAVSLVIDVALVLFGIILLIPPYDPRHSAFGQVLAACVFTLLATVNLIDDIMKRNGIPK